MRHVSIHRPDLNVAGFAIAMVLALVACGASPQPPGDDIETVTLPGGDRTNSASTESSETSPASPANETESSPSPDDAGANDATDESGATDDSDQTETTEEPPAGDEASPPPASEETPLSFTLNDTESLLYAQVWKDDTLLSGFAHNHVLRATGWSGSITYDPQDLSVCTIAFELPVDQLRNDEPAMREFAGLQGEISGEDRETIRESMLSEGQLNGDRYPTITFASTACEGEEGTDARLTVQGGLTIRGATKDISLSVNFQLQDGRLYAQGSIEALHQDFGFEPYSAFFGAVKNAPRIRIGFDVVGISPSS